MNLPTSVKPKEQFQTISSTKPNRLRQLRQQCLLSVIQFKLPLSPNELSQEQGREEFLLLPLTSPVLLDKKNSAPEPKEFSAETGMPLKNEPVLARLLLALLPRLSFPFP